MLKVYGSEMCPDCIECKFNLDRNNIEYENKDSLPVMVKDVYHWRGAFRHFPEESAGEWKNQCHPFN